MTLHPPKFLLTLLVVLSQPPLFIVLPPPYLWVSVSHGLPSASHFPLYLVSRGEILCFHGFKYQPCADESPNVLCKSPRLLRAPPTSISDHTLDVSTQGSHTHPKCHMSQRDFTHSPQACVYPVPFFPSQEMVPPRGLSLKSRSRP